MPFRPNPVRSLSLAALALLAPATASAHEGHAHAGPVAAAPAAAASTEQPVGTVAPLAPEGGTVAVTGTLALLHADRRDGSSSDTVVVTTARGPVPVAFADGAAPDEHLLGDRVRVAGERDADRLVATSADDPAAVQTLAAAAAPATTGTRRVAVVLLTFTDAPAPAVPVSEAQAAFFGAGRSVRSFFAETSYGALQLGGDVLGPFALPLANGSGCDFGGWANAARQAAGARLDGYDHVVYALPASPGCPWGGQAYIGGRESWLNGPYVFGSTAAHEIGHNLGSDHARAARCYALGDDRPDEPALANGNCRQLEYGDPFDVMGGAQARTYAGFSAWRRHRLGWLRPDAVVTDTVGGRYRLAPTERAADGTARLLRIPLPDGRVLTLDHRQVSGAFGPELVPGSPVTRGATLRLEVPSASTAVDGLTTALLDATPETTGQGFYGLNLDDAALLPHATFADPLGAVAITVTGQDATGVSLSVVRAPGDVVPPGAPGRVTVTRSGGTATVSFAPAADDAGVAGYRILRDGVGIGTTASTTFSDPSAGTGRRVYAVRAYDAAGNHGPESRRVPTVADTSVPETPQVTMIAPWEGDAAQPLTLQWPAVRDDVGVERYRVRRGGVLLGETRATTWVDPFVWNAGHDPGWTVEAVDAAGNVSGRGRVSAPVELADATAPAAPATVTASAGTGVVMLRWRGSPDAVGYKVFRDGRLLGESWGTGYDAGPPPPPGARQRYTVRAFDASRNTGAAAAVEVVTAGAPSARTDEPVDVTGEGATLTGALDPNLGAVRWWFEWGVSTAYGNSTPPVELAAGAAGGVVTARLAGLTPGRTYHARLVVEGVATAVGADRVFTTQAPPATVPTTDPPPPAPVAAAALDAAGAPAVPPVASVAPARDRPIVRPGTARAVASVGVVAVRRLGATVVLRVRVSSAGTLRVRAGSRLLATVRVARPGVVAVRLRPSRVVRTVAVELTPAGRKQLVRRVVRLPR